jgi:cell shape-determining protein MreC
LFSLLAVVYAYYIADFSYIAMPMYTHQSTAHTEQDMTLRNEKLTEQLQELQAAYEQQAQHSQLQQQLQPVTAQPVTARSSSSSATTTDDQQSSSATRLRELEERVAATTRDMARVQAAHRHEVHCCVRL